jgi:hypothetical protein
MIATLKVTLKGIAPLIHHADRLANPLHPLKKRMAALTGNRKKTDEIHEEIAKTEWFAGLYLDPTGKFPVVPGINFDATIREGAKASKRGKDVQRAVWTEEEFSPMVYTGPKDPEKMWEAGNFADVRSVVVSRARVMRTRPIFHEWQVVFHVNYDADIVNPEDLRAWIDYAGRYCGMCEYRPRFGKFSAAFG